jgi:hypothetical protein
MEAKVEVVSPKKGHCFFAATLGSPVGGSGDIEVLNMF